MMVRQMFLFAPLVVFLPACMHLGALGMHGQRHDVAGDGTRQISSVRLGSYRMSGTFGNLELGVPSSHEIAVTGQEPSGLIAEASAEFLVEYSADPLEAGTTAVDGPFSVIRDVQVDLNKSRRGTVAFTASAAGRYVLRFVVTVVHTDGTSMTGEVESEYRISPMDAGSAGHGAGIWGSDGLWLVVPIVMMGGMALYAIFAGRVF